MRSRNVNDRADQYSITKILGIWAAAALPMALLSWVFPPLLDPLTGWPIGLDRAFLLTLGLIWQFVLVLLIVWREEGNLRWATLKNRLWLQAPCSPRTGTVNRWLWLWLPLFLVAYGVLTQTFSPRSAEWVGQVFPALAQPAQYSMDSVFGDPSALVGRWDIFVLMFVLSLFNTVLGEELIFRGVLLPRMQGAFGRWDWVANGVLHGLYHLHQPWGIIGSIIDVTFGMALPSRLFRSAWFGIIVHSAQSVYILFLILGVVLGLA
jgi:uncharacterized protein